MCVLPFIENLLHLLRSKLKTLDFHVKIKKRSFDKPKNLLRIRLKRLI